MVSWGSYCEELVSPFTYEKSIKEVTRRTLIRRGLDVGLVDLERDLL